MNTSFFVKRGGGMGDGQTYLTFGTWMTRRMVLILKESRRLVRGAGLR